MISLALRLQSSLSSNRLFRRSLKANSQELRGRPNYSSFYEGALAIISS